MSTLNQEQVLSVHHWNESLFSFKTTRNPGFRFRNGHFVMIGLEVEGRPLLRAFSVASANYDEHLEFYSIKIPDGALTSRLQHIQPGEPILVGRKPTGTLLVDNLLPGKRLYLLATGTGLAPFMSIIRDPETYERFEHVVVAHGVRRVSDLGYRELHRGRAAAARAGRRAGARRSSSTTRRSPASPSATRGASTICSRAASCSADLGLPAAGPGARPGDDLRQPRNAEGPRDAPRGARLPARGTPTTRATTSSSEPSSEK